MVASYYDTITRLENIVRELECEFLYLINDIQSGEGESRLDPEMSLSRLELARHCLSAAAEALSRDQPAELVS